MPGSPCPLCTPVTMAVSQRYAVSRAPCGGEQGEAMREKVLTKFCTKQKSNIEAIMIIMLASEVRKGIELRKSTLKI